jgi:DNA-binding MarR family transcriptional regulator
MNTKRKQSPRVSAARLRKGLIVIPVPIREQVKEDTRHGTSAAPAQHDFVDHMVAEWKVQSPWIDAIPVAIIVRMKRATAIFDRARDRLGKSFGIGNGEIMVLDALRRVGPPNRLNPGRLLQELMAPSGTMTSWIDKLSKLGFVKRMADPDDRRGVLVQLTARGRRVASEVDKMAREQWHGTPHAALADFKPTELEDLADLLRKLCISLEDSSDIVCGEAPQGAPVSASR